MAARTDAQRDGAFGNSSTAGTSPTPHRVILAMAAILAQSTARPQAFNRTVPVVYDA
jgi:hypothetical protein